MGRARVQRDVVVRQVRTLFTLGTIDEMTDGRLLERFTTFADDSAEAAFTALVERHGPMVLRVCRSVLHDRHDAEDAFQATFLVMVRRARSLWVRDSLGPWLYQVAHRTAARARTIETQRRRRERKAALGLVAEVEERPPDDLDEALHEEVARLPERYRAAVVLCLLEGLPNEQAARRLGWPVGTVQSRLARGRERLKRSLTRRGLAPSVAIAAAAALPPKLAEATLQSALRYAATGSQAAAVSSSILVLTEGVLRMMTLAKLKTGLLALAAVGGLGLATVAVPRSMGAAGQEAPHVLDEPAPTPKSPEQEARMPTASEAIGEPAPDPAASTVLIRIKVGSKETYGLGTVIKSTPTESIVLTCGRIIPEAIGLASDPPAKIKVMYFGTTQVLKGIGRSTGLTASAFSLEQDAAELIDRDLTRNVALIRTHPDRVLPASPIVPRSWEPRPGMTMTAVPGLPEGQIGAPAECSILGTAKGLFDSPSYEAIECSLIAKQFTAGSGLFTKGPSGEGNLLAGVRNFSTTPGDTSVYASPRMIYPILDKNGLAALYLTEGQKAQSAADLTSSIGKAGPSTEVSEAVDRVIPYPTQTTLKIRVDGGKGKSISAAGTIISSNPKETIILTSAGVFAAGAGRISVTFPVGIRLIIGPREEVSGSVVQTSGELMDVDPTHGVALFRIRPGRVFPASPIAPRNWRPRPGMRMNAMPGLGESMAAQFEQRPILGVVKGEGASSGYEAIECDVVPKQSSAGSGLFTCGSQGEENYLAGVCNFSDPKTNTALYASPEMIRCILDKNGLTSLSKADVPKLIMAPEPGFPLRRVGQDATPADPKTFPSPERPEPVAPARQPDPKSSTKPDWLTTVRLKIGGEAPKQALGTIIKSTPDEAIVLTCASIFSLDGNEPQPRPAPAPAKYPHPISVELLTYRAHVAPNYAVAEGCPGDLVDVDHQHNVALIRIRPTRQGPAARIVSPGWSPRKDTPMGLWNTRGDMPSPRIAKVLRPSVPTMVRLKNRTVLVYEGIECGTAPRQRALGGGLFAVPEPGGNPIDELVAGREIYLAGVCNFTSPESDAGIYAAPSMIYSILDRNGLSALYRTGNEEMNFAPKQGFSAPAPAGSSANELPSVADGPPAEDRLRSVERRVDAIDGKLDEILGLLRKPH